MEYLRCVRYSIDSGRGERNRDNQNIKKTNFPELTYFLPRAAKRAYNFVYFSAAASQE